MFFSKSAPRRIHELSWWIDIEHFTLCCYDHQWHGWAQKSSPQSCKLFKCTFWCHLKLSEITSKLCCHSQVSGEAAEPSRRDWCWCRGSGCRGRSHHGRVRCTAHSGEIPRGSCPRKPENRLANGHCLEWKDIGCLVIVKSWIRFTVRGPLRHSISVELVNVEFLHLLWKEEEKVRVESLGSSTWSESCMLTCSPFLTSTNSSFCSVRLS